MKSNNWLIISLDSHERADPNPEEQENDGLNRLSNAWEQRYNPWFEEVKKEINET